MSAPATGIAVALAVWLAMLSAREAVWARAGQRIRGRLDVRDERGAGTRRVPRWVAEVISRAAPEHDPELVARAGAIAAVTCALAGLVVAGTPGLLAGAVASCGALGGALAVLGDRRARLADAALVEWIDASARQVRAGASLAQALVGATSAVETTPVAARLERFARTAQGAGLGAAIDGLAAADASPTTELVRRALRVAVATGGPAGRMLDGVAASLRDRAAAELEVRALSTQARGSALVMAAAPLGFAAVTAATDPRVAGFVLASPFGWACLATGVGFEAVGAWWMARLIRRAA